MSRLFAGTFICLLVVGCGGGMPTAPVLGIITLDGKPLENVSVTFSPEAAGLEVTASNGRTDASGHYTLSETATGKVGAAVGKHVVTIAFIGKESKSDISDPNEVNPVPPHDLSFEVKSGPNKADFELKSKPKS